MYVCLFSHPVPYPVARRKKLWCVAPPPFEVACGDVNLGNDVC